MRISTRKKLWALVAVAAMGTAFQMQPAGCAEYWTFAGLSAFDFCSVFNCEGGAFFDLCNPVPLLVDCPGYGQQ